MRDRARWGAPSLGGDARVVVIGGGAAGLAAAHALVQTGYRRVTVLERSSRVGGKCCTVQIDGRGYELGAAVLTTAYHHVRELMAETGMKAVPKVSGLCLDVDTGATSYRVPALHGAAFRGLRDSARMILEVMRRGVRAPGFRNLPEELAEPFGPWAEKHGLSIAAKVLEPWFTAWGYGYIDEIPAAYALKYASLSGPMFEILDGGYQGLWERVAARLDVRRGVTVRRVVRSGDGVTVETDRETLSADALVLACPLDDALEFLDASAEERALFGKVVYNDYRVVAASVQGVNDARYLFFPKHFERPSVGQPMFSYKRWPGSDVRVFYSFGPPGSSIDQTVKDTEAFVQRLGGRVTRVHRAEAWRYFPHVVPDDFRAGFYDSVDALQGKRKTYYAGELLALGTVETVVAHARALVKEHLAAQGTALRAVAGITPR